MDCIQTSNKAVDLFGAGRHGFAAGNPGAGVLATYFSPAWANGVQEEILNVIRSGGIVPSGADLTQLLQAIQVLTGGPGQIRAFARTTAPAGMLKCNGAAISRTTYAALFAVIGTTFGAGDGATTFNLPDLRGEFIRGWDDGRSVDAGRTMGSAQAGQNASHTHPITVDAVGSHSHGGATAGVGDHQHNTNIPVKPNGTGSGPYAMVDGINGITGSQGQVSDPAGAHAHGITADGAHAHTASSSASGGSEARPRNVALLYCITY